MNTANRFPGLARPSRGQDGMMLLEALLGILLFSIGILGLIGMQGVSIKNTSEARYRSEAAYLANQIVGRMWIDRANLASYALTSGTTCNAASTTALQQWLCQVETSLPGITTVAATRPTIAIATDRVTVTMHWRVGGINTAITDGSDIRNFVLITRIN
jgi:type IV pilus assembly protein PilV